MRLGAYPCVLAEGSLAQKLYGKKKISERHRHRYEFNNEYRERLEEQGLVLSGISPDGSLVEMIELTDHPWFLGQPVPPRVQVAAARLSSDLPRVHPRRAGASRRGAGAVRASLQELRRRRNDGAKSASAT